MGGQAGVDKEPYGANNEPPLIIFKQVWLWVFFRMTTFVVVKKPNQSILKMQLENAGYQLRL